MLSLDVSVTNVHKVSGQVHKDLVGHLKALITGSPHPLASLALMEVGHQVDALACEVLTLKFKKNLVQFSVLFHMEVFPSLLCLLVQEVCTRDHNDRLITCSRNVEGRGEEREEEGELRGNGRLARGGEHFHREHTSQSGRTQFNVST